MQNHSDQSPSLLSISLTTGFHVFKTSVDNADQIAMLRPYLDSWLGSGTWNFDLNDCDRILRTPGTIAPAQIMGLLSSFDFECITLD